MTLTEQQRLRQFRVEELSIPDYQPKHRREDVQAIVDAFDPEALGPLMVSVRGGKFFVVDGSRRLTACRIKGYEGPLDCYTLYGLTEAREKQLLLILDQRTKQNAVDRFRIAADSAGSGNPAAERAKQISDELARHGLMVHYHHSATTINSPRALEVLFLWGSLPTVLRVIRGAWPADDYGTLPNMLMALGAFDRVYREREYDEFELTLALKSWSPRKIVQDAQAARREGVRKSKGELGGNTIWAAVASLGLRPAYHEYLKQVDAAWRSFLLPAFKQPAVPNSELLISRPPGGARVKKET